MRKRLTTLCIIGLCFSTVANAKIVFSSSRDGVKGIYVMDDDGTGVTLLTDALSPGNPRWSPSGKQIMFARPVAQHSSSYAIFLMNADGTNIRQLTVPPDNGRDSHASFSPDGKSILFKRNDPDNEKRSVNIMVLKSGSIKKISEIKMNRPEFSPDGQSILFYGINTIGIGGSYTNIWIMRG